MFFGTQREVTSYPEDGGVVTTSRDVEFGPIQLNVAHKGLYSAWEDNIWLRLEDFRNGKGELVTAERQVWITKCPGVLIFQVNRSSYDPEARALRKVHDEFVFEKEVYADMFLLKNKEDSLQIQKRVSQFRKQVDKL